MNKTTVTIPISQSGNYIVSFPNRCVYCGQPSETTIEVTPTYTEDKSTTMTINKTTYRFPLSIPYCAKHARESSRNKSILYGVFFLCLLPTIFLTWRMEPSSFGQALIVFLFYCLVAFPIGILMQWLVRKILSYAFPSLSDTGIVIPGVIGGSDSALGISPSIRITSDTLGRVGLDSNITISFTNDEVARECASLSGGTYKVPQK